MKILILGGSNSLSADGWVRHMAGHFAVHLGRTVEITNLSVGGTTSLGAVARLLARPDLGEFDVVVHEYALNDTGHLNHRTHGVAHWRAIQSILMTALAERTGRAIFVPVILAARSFFALDVANRIYDAQKAACAGLGLAPVDIRRWMHDGFGPWPPDFLYADESHYHHGTASAVIGSLVAERITALAADPATPRIAEVRTHGVAAGILDAVAVDFLGPDRLAPHVVGPCERLERANGFMTVPVLRLAAGARLALDPGMALATLVLASDLDHRAIRLRTAAYDGLVATRYADLEPGRFLHANIPPALIEDRPASALAASDTRIVVEVPASVGARLDAFDCFVPPTDGAAPNRLDLAGLVCARFERAPGGGR